MQKEDFMTNRDRLSLAMVHLIIGDAGESQTQLSGRAFLTSYDFNPITNAINFMLRCFAHTYIYSMKKKEIKAVSIKHESIYVVVFCVFGFVVGQPQPLFDTDFHGGEVNFVICMLEVDIRDGGVHWYSLFFFFFEDVKTGTS